MVNLAEVNYLAVLIATVATMALGFLWYSPVLLGNAWVKQRGMKMEDISGGGAAHLCTDSVNRTWRRVYFGALADAYR